MPTTSAMLAPLSAEQPVYGYRPANVAAPPAISVITPFFNTGPLFFETAQSLLRQSFQNWEWIIVNDGSTDATALQVLLAFRSAEPRVQVIDQANQGVSAARNTGIALARAPFLLFLDSDDLLAPTALEKLAWSLVSRPNSAMVTAWRCLFGEENQAWPRGFDSRHALLSENMMNPLALFRREVFAQVGGFETARRGGLEDYEFWLRCAANGLWGHDVREFLLWVRRKAPEGYRGYRWEFDENAAALDRFNRDMRARYPALFRDGLPTLPGRGGGLLDTYPVIESALPFENTLEHPAGQRRVLVLMPWVRVGGADRFVLDLAAGLVERGQRVSVCLLRDEDHTWMPELVGITPDVFNLAAFLAPADYPRFLHYLVASRQIDTVLVANSQLAYQLLPYLRAHCPGVRVFDYQHMEEEHWRDGGLPRAGLDAAAFLDMHIVASQHLAEWMIARGAEPERTHVCTINIDAERWQRDPARGAALRAELGVGRETLLALFPARLVAQKRPRLLAEIIRQVRDSGVNLVCLVAGDGPDRRWLEQFVRRYRLGGQLRILGALAAEQVRDLFHAADVMLLPSEHEGIALAIYEAMAMGVVPVAADVGGQRELVTPETGVLVPPGPGELAAYVTALRELARNPQQRRAMAQAARQRIETNFTRPAMFERMFSLFAQADELARVQPRPEVSVGQAHAATVLAIESFQLETRLRRLPPVRLALRLRQSPVGRLLPLLAGLRRALARFDRGLYAARRGIMKRIRQ